MKSLRTNIVSALPRGVALIEFSFVAIIFAALLIALADFARYAAVKYVLTLAAQEGARRAATLTSLNIDAHSIPSTDTLTYQALWDARQEVLSFTEQTATVAFLSRSTLPSMATLHAYSGIADGWTGIRPTEPLMNASLLRPGEAISIDGQTRRHPTDCPTGAPPSCRGYRPGANYETVLRENPIIVELTATFRGVLPGIGPFIVRGRSMRYKELAPSGSFTITPPNASSTGSSSSLSSSESSSPEPSSSASSTSASSSEASSVSSSEASSVSSDSSFPGSLSSSSYSSSIDSESSSSLSSELSSEASSSSADSISSNSSSSSSSSSHSGICYYDDDCAYLTCPAATNACCNFQQGNGVYGLCQCGDCVE